MTTPEEPHHPELDVDHLVAVITTALRADPSVDRAGPTGSKLPDRMAINAIGHDGKVWRIHVLDTPADPNVRKLDPPPRGPRGAPEVPRCRHCSLRERDHNHMSHQFDAAPADA